MDGEERDHVERRVKKGQICDYELFNFSKEFNYKTSRLRDTRSYRLRRSRITKCVESVSCTFE